MLRSLVGSEMCIRDRVTPYPTNRNVFKLPEHISARPSAVLIPLVEIGDELQIVLTKRAAHLKHHAGQISFPGGKVEEQDKSLIDTALREAEEEIGIPASNVRVLGELTAYHTITGFSIKPIIGLLQQSQSYQPDTQEVESVFHVPLSFCLATNNFSTIDVKRKQLEYPVYFIPYQEHFIWGATAAILHDLANHLSA